MVLTNVNVIVSQRVPYFQPAARIYSPPRKKLPSKVDGRQHGKPQPKWFMYDTPWEVRLRTTPSTIKFREQPGGEGEGRSMTLEKSRPGKKRGRVKKTTRAEGGAQLSFGLISGPKRNIAIPIKEIYSHFFGVHLMCFVRPAQNERSD